MSDPPDPVAARRARATVLSLEYGGVLSRRALREVGVDRRMVGREVKAGRWVRHGVQTVSTTNGPLDPVGRRWRAVWEVGALVAAVDGVSALQHAGMTGFDDDRVHVSVRHTTEVEDVEGVVIHKVVRRVPHEVVGAGLPRTVPAVAAVRAAHWAVSDRQAALLLVLPVQQRLCTGAQLREAVAVVRGRTRRAFVRTVVADIADGAHSLGEIDVVEALRRRGLPPPTRQAVRHLPGGKAYLDLEWAEARLVVEVDGSGHLAGLQMFDDTLRQNDVQLGDELVLRVALLGWRLSRDAYLDQICAAYRSRVGRFAA